MATVTESETVVYPLRIEAEVMRRVARVAKKEDRTRAWVIREAVSEYLKAKGVK